MSYRLPLLLGGGGERRQENELKNLTTSRLYFETRHIRNFHPFYSLLPWGIKGIDFPKKFSFILHM